MHCVPCVCACVCVCVCVSVAIFVIGPYYIAEGKMTFGRPTRYYQLNPSSTQKLDWDRGVQASDLNRP